MKRYAVIGFRHPVSWTVDSRAVRDWLKEWLENPVPLSADRGAGLEGPRSTTDRNVTRTNLSLPRDHVSALRSALRAETDSEALRRLIASHLNGRAVVRPETPAAITVRPTQAPAQAALTARPQPLLTGEIGPAPRRILPGGQYEYIRGSRSLVYREPWPLTWVDKERGMTTRGAHGRKHWTEIVPAVLMLIISAVVVFVFIRRSRVADAPRFVPSGPDL